MTRRVFPSMVLVLAVVALGPGCNKDKAEPAGDKAKGAAAEDAKADGGETGAAAAGETGAGEAEAGAAATDTDTDTGEELPPLPEEFESLGVDICDEYVADYVRCIDEKVPEAEREAQRRVVFENVKSWKQIKAGGEAGLKSLQTGCKIAREQAKRATQSWACEW